MFGCCSKNTVDARIVNNALVVSLMGGEQPRVWRAEMAHMATASIELLEEGGKHKITLKDKEGNTQEVASFKDRREALDALSCITRAMMGGGEKTRRSGWLGRIFKGAAFLLALFFAFALYVILFVVPSPMGPLPQSGAPATKTGVPVPADELFGQ